jgi:two-component system, OmpR family, copper resistance phosphate regulon response regulator CusR
MLTVADLSLDTGSHQVTRGGNKIVRSAREFATLKHLMRSVGLVLTRTMVTEHVWDYDVFSQSNAVDGHIRNLCGMDGESHAIGCRLSVDIED